MEKRINNHLSARIILQKDDRIFYQNGTPIKIVEKGNDQKNETKISTRKSYQLNHLKTDLNEKYIKLEANENGKRKSRAVLDVMPRRKREQTSNMEAKRWPNFCSTNQSTWPKLPLYLKTESIMERLINKSIAIVEQGKEDDVRENIEKEKENASDNIIHILDDDEGVVGDLISPENCVNFAIMDGPESDDSSNDVMIVEPSLDVLPTLPATVTQCDECVNSHLPSFEAIDIEEHALPDSIDSEMAAKVSEPKMCIGTVVWARLGNFPFWPAFVCTDKEPEVDKICVKFLADNGRLSRLTRDRIIAYEGLTQFQQYAEEMRHKVQGRNTHRKMFHIRSKKWDQAVAEADVLVQIGIVHREKFYDECLFKFLYGSSNTSGSTVSYDSSYGTIGIPYPPRPTSTPCTVDTAYSSMKQSPITLFDDVDEINVALIENDALDNGKDSASATETYDERQFEHIQFQNLYEKVKINSANVFQSNIDPAVNSDDVRNALFKIWNMKMTEQPKACKRPAEAPSVSSIPRTKRQRSIVTKKSQTSIALTEQKKPEVKTPQASEMDKAEKERERAQEWRERIMGSIIKNYAHNPLFRGLPKGPVCRQCHKPENVLRCQGACGLDYHVECVGAIPNGLMAAQPKVHVTGDGVHIEDIVADAKDIPPQLMLCAKCRSGAALTSKCFACNKDCDDPSDTVCCTDKMCKKFYHRSCLKYWPQAQFNVTTGAFKDKCPFHVCQTCESDDVRRRFNESDRCLIKCIQCPASYHRKTSCVPAGSHLLSDTHMICPRHRDYNKKPVNANWCFFCGVGGDLVCCETCPATYHHKCLADLKLDPGERYICEICESGRLPLYGEIVWVKYAHYKWWPAITVPPWKIPDTVLPSQQRNYFCVLFFGKSKCYGWACKDNVYRYEEDDWLFDKSSSRKDAAYNLAIEEGKEYYTIIKEMPASYKDPKRVQHKPTPYIRIKSNRPVPPVRFDENNEKDDIDSECKCKFDEENPCGQWSNCLNQLTYTECGANCKAGVKCENQRFQKRIYPNIEVRKVEGKGWGLFAAEEIKSGTFIIEYVGEVINFDEFQRRFHSLVEQKCDMFYLLSLDGTLFIDAGPKGNEARFINHSCDPNSDPQKWTVKGMTRIGFFANRDIPLNAEITFDYNWCGIPGGLQDSELGLKPCCCGTDKCSGFIGKPKDPHVSKKKL